MGWGSGVELAEKIERIMEKAKDRFTPEEIAKMGDDFAEAFMGMDCDTLEDSHGFIGDAANRRNHHTAPKNAEKGARYTDNWDCAYEFDGRRWREADG